MSQTDGADLALPPEPRLLVGQAPPGLWDALAAQVTRAGFVLSDAPDAAAIGGANGVTNFTTRTVTVRADMDPAARVKTLAHELSHVCSMPPKRAPTRPRGPGRCTGGCGRSRPSPSRT